MDICFQHCPLHTWYNIEVWTCNSDHTLAMSTVRAESFCVYRGESKGKTCANLDSTVSLSFTCYCKPGQYLTTPLLPTHPHEMKVKYEQFFLHLPAHWFWSWPSSRGIALLEDVVTQQRLSSRLAEWTHHFQFSPGSVHKQLLGLLWVSIRGVEENKSILRQDSTTHLTSVRAAVTCITLVQLAVEDKSTHTE